MPALHQGYFTAGLEADPELGAAISGEHRRQQDQIELIASENIVRAASSRRRAPSSPTRPSRACRVPA